MAHEGWHESESSLSEENKDRHRALVSIEEELEAVDWYDQRIEATGNAELKAILAHNRDEEKEHAAMVLEWLRRNDAAVDGALRQYLFSSGSIVGREAEVTDRSSGPGAADAGGARSGGAATDGSLGIGSLKGRV